MGKHKKKRFSIMQKLSSWFEQLPLRRRGSNRRADAVGPNRQKSKSAAPRLRYSVSAVQNYRHRDHSVDILSQPLINDEHQPHAYVPASWNRQETVTNPCCDINKPAIASLSQSFSAAYASGRKTIRTNPWISRPPVRPSIFEPQKPPKDLFYSSIDRTATLRVKSLDESTCSSGYGSQDSGSSPESSMHSPDWQPSLKQVKKGHLEDKAVECNSIDVDEALGLDFDYDNISDDYKLIVDDCSKDEHIYHELEAFNRLSLLLDERACSSDSEFTITSDCSGCSSRSSPIYAQPYGNWTQEVTEYPNTASSFTYIPCAKYRLMPQFHAPPPPPPFSFPPPPPSTSDDDFEQVELDFLTELDAQIAELQEKSVAVRQLVDEARERRDARARNAQFHSELAELHRMKWALHSHFELVL